MRQDGRIHIRKLDAREFTLCLIDPWLVAGLKIRGLQQFEAAYDFDQRTVGETDSFNIAGTQLERNHSAVPQMNLQVLL